MKKVVPKKRSLLKSIEWSEYREVFAIVSLSVAAYVGLSLFSFEPSDPSFQTRSFVSNQGVHNMGGLIGSYLSDFLIQIFGYASLVIPLAFLWASLFFAFAKDQKLRFSIMFGWTLLLVCSSIFLSTIENFNLMVATGGWLGLQLKTFLQTYTGNFGMMLFVIAGIMVSMGLVFGLNLEKMARFSTWIASIVSVQSKKFWAVSKKILIQIKDKGSKIIHREEEIIKATMKEIQTDPNVIPIRKSKPETPTKLPEKQPRLASLDKKDLPPIVIPTRKVKEEEISHLPDREIKVEDVQKKSAFTLPKLSLLDEHEQQALNFDKEALLENASILENKLKDFGVLGKVVEVQPGPVVTMYEFEPAPGVKVNKITSLGDDLTLALRALSVRIALIPGKSVIGIEVSNPEREVVYIKDIIDDGAFEKSKSKLTMSLGKDISGNPVVGDLRKMPHLLVAGATGSGKSVAINSMLVSVLYKATPDDVRMILVDPKMLELSLYDNIPHLLLPVVTDPKKASAALKWAVREMEKRYRLMAQIGVRNIEGYNSKVDEYMKKHPRASYEENMDVKPETHDGPMPLIMIVIDELADLMMVASKDVEDSIIRLAQMARASGIHLLLATQRPSVDVITGVIKANMPSRISFQVSSKIDSRTILDANGAEQLLGAGDMLFMPPGTSKIQRLHGSFISDEEVGRITDFWKEQADPQYNEEILKAGQEDTAGGLDSGDPEEDEMYRQAIEIVKERGVASISYIQRRLRIGYNRAARLVERMEEDGFLAPGEVGKPREVLTHHMP